LSQNGANAAGVDEKRKVKVSDVMQGDGVAKLIEDALSRCEARGLLELFLGCEKWVMHRQGAALLCAARQMRPRPPKSICVPRTKQSC
jgi:hypothetical protein